MTMGGLQSHIVSAILNILIIFNLENLAMSPIRGILLLASFFTTVNVSAETIIPSEEEKNQLTVYMIKSSVDDPIFTA
ncbi:MAG: hypothetical protein KC426_09565, partial [Oceanospirillaceae bacterium]|nr:hypothetical protein [Oceanospirillaceae bacterium]